MKPQLPPHFSLWKTSSKKFSTSNQNRLKISSKITRNNFWYTTYSPKTHQNFRLPFTNPLLLSGQKIVNDRALPFRRRWEWLFFGGDIECDVLIKSYRFRKLYRSRSSRPLVDGKRKSRLNSISTYPALLFPSSSQVRLDGVQVNLGHRCFDVVHVESTCKSYIL